MGKRESSHKIGNSAKGGCMNEILGRAAHMNQLDRERQRGIEHDIATSTQRANAFIDIMVAHRVGKIPLYYLKQTLIPGQRGRLLRPPRDSYIERVYTPLTSGWLLNEVDMRDDRPTGLLVTEGPHIYVTDGGITTNTGPEAPTGQFVVTGTQTGYERPAAFVGDLGLDIITRAAQRLAPAAFHNTEGAL